MFQLIRKKAVHCIIILFVIFCDNSATKAQNLGFDFSGDHKSVTVPFELYNNLIVVPILLNGKYPLKFILDTGVRSTIIIDKSFTDSLNIQYDRKIELFGLGKEQSVNALVAGDISMTMPGVTCSGLSVLVLEEDFLHLEPHLGVKVHGLIGYDIFSRFVLKINYIDKQLELFKPLDYEVNKKYEAIDLDIYEAKPYMKVQIQLNPVDSIMARLMIDTGASHALVLNRESSEKIDIPVVSIETKLGRGLTGEINGHLGRIDGIYLGKKRLSHVITSFPAGAEYDKNDNKNGSIGGELLKKYSVIFDYYRNKIYLKPNATFKHPFEYNMSGLEFSAEGEQLDQFVISHIRKNSAASGVGFELGDLVVSLNNIPAKKLTLSKIYTSLNLKDGKKINLTVYRNGKYYSKTFHLKREI